MMKDVFRYPQHNERAGICFLCNATPTTMRQTGSDAPWRAGRLDHWAVLARIAEKGLPISPLFQAPGVRVDVCKVDWLHVVDLGVGPDWIGPTKVPEVGMQNTTTTGDANGEIIKASMRPGDRGFAMAHFPGEEEFETEVTNVMMQAIEAGEKIMAKKLRRMKRFIKRPAAAPDAEKIKKRPAAAVASDADQKSGRLVAMWYKAHHKLAIREIVNKKKQKQLFQLCTIIYSEAELRAIGDAAIAVESSSMM